MTDTTPLARPNGRKSGRATQNILIFVIGAAIILVTIIAFTKTGDEKFGVGPHPEDFDNTPTATTPGKTTPGGTGYVERGVQPDKNPSTPKNTGNPNPAPPKVKTVKYVGDVDRKEYHKPDCKRLQFVDDKKKVPFSSAGEAYTGGYIPCKVCKPPLPTSEESPSGDTTRMDKPVPRPIKDVVVPFKFRVVSSEPDIERGVVRIDVEVDLDAPLKKQEDILLLSQKIVAMETAKRAVSSVSIAMHSTVNSTTVSKWVCMVDWAPYGKLTRANEVKAGDYKQHQFYIYMNGYLKR